MPTAISFYYLYQDKNYAMLFSKLFQYVYLIFAALFLYEGIANWGSNKSYLPFLFAALAIFIFFFRRKFSQKYSKKDDLK